MEVKLFSVVTNQQNSDLWLWLWLWLYSWCLMQQLTRVTLITTFVSYQRPVFHLTFTFTPSSEVPSMAILHITFSMGVNEGDCYFIQLPTIKVKGIPGSVSIDSNWLPLAVWILQSSFSVVHFVLQNWTRPFQGSFPFHQNGSSYNFVGPVFDDNTTYAVW